MNLKRKIKSFIAECLSLALICGMLCAVPLTATAANSETCDDNLTWTPDDNGTLTTSGTGYTQDYDSNDPTRYDRDSTFVDLPEDSEYLEYVENVYASGVMPGFDNGHFYPERNITRAELAFYLYNLAGHINGQYPEIGDINYKFSDCDPDMWYYNYVVWSCGNGILSGVSSTSFAPDSIVSHEQAVTLLYRLFSLLSFDIDAYADADYKSKFADIKKVSAYAIVSVSTLDKIIKLSEKTKYFNPDAPTTNSWLAEILSLLIDNIPTFDKTLDQPLPIPTYGSDDDLTWTLNENGFLTISGTGDMWDDRPWGNYCYFITDVQIDDGVTSIGNNAFAQCQAIKSITLPDSITSIGESAFYGCVNLKSITIPDGVTSIGNNAFYLCDSLTIYGTIGSYAHDYANANEIPFAEIESAPKGEMCGDNLTWKFINGTLTISGTGDMSDYDNFHAQPWEDICTKITAIQIEDGVTSIGGFAFYGCEALKSISIPDSVTSFGDCAFFWCSALKSITIPNDLTNIGEFVFFGCSSLKTIQVNENNPNYTLVDEVLYTKDKKQLICCPRGKNEVEIPNGVTSIVECAFEGCNALTDIVIPDSVKYIGNFAFRDCSALTGITLPDSAIILGDDVFYGTAYYKNNDNWENEVLYLGNCLIDAKDSIDGSYSVRHNTVTIAGGAFRSCKELKSITLPDNVKYIGDMAFMDCYALKSITLSDSLTYIGDSAFYFCYALEGITIPENVTSIGESAFRNCDALTSITIPDSVTSIGDSAFQSCNSLTSITLSDSMTGIGDMAFYECSALSDITIPNSVTYIGDSAFYYCKALKSVTLSDSVTYIGNSAFYYCDSLKSIVIPDGVTSIGNEAFAHCILLSNITIPDSVTTIEKNAFFNCPRLTIYGYNGSYVQTYAKNNDIPFVAGAIIGDKFFKDVIPGAWYENAVQYAVEHNLFNGVSPIEFAPNESMTRAMLVTVLWRMEGEPTESAENPFTDVPSGEWYTDAVKWAAANGIVKGTTEETFDPDGDITREQMATILHRYAEKKEYDITKSEDLGAFPDGAKTSDYAVDALSWAYAEKLITGVKEGKIDYLDPQGDATRAQVATILMRFAQDVAK